MLRAFAYGCLRALVAAAAVGLVAVALKLAWQWWRFRRERRLEYGDPALFTIAIAGNLALAYGLLRLFLLLKSP